MPVRQLTVESVKAKVRDFAGGRMAEERTPASLRALAARMRRVAAGLTDRKFVHDLEMTATNLEAEAERIERTASGQSSTQAAAEDETQPQPGAKKPERQRE